MAAPFRITKPGTGVVAVSAGGEEGFKIYLERLVKMIPAEVISLYMVVTGFVEAGQTTLLLIVSIICLFAVFAVRIWGTRDPAKGLPVSWPQVIISAVAFVIWIYWIGGPFEAYNIHYPNIASILIVFWSFFVPMFYKGAEK